MKRLVVLSAVLYAACGDRYKIRVDAAPDIDAPDDHVDAAVDAPPGFVAPTPFSLAVSGAGPDLIMSAAAGPNGTFYVAGHAAATPTGAKMVFIARVKPTGALDGSFGIGGVFVSAYEFKGGNDEVDVVVQSDGKIVVSATIANNSNAADTDVGLFRVSASGLLDATFGNTGTTPGYSRVNLSTAYDSAGLKAKDAVRALAVGPSDQLFIHAISRDEVAEAGVSIDQDFTVARLSALGILDGTYGTTNGKTLTELDETDKLANPRGIVVLADGSVIASGYAKTNASGGSTQPVLYKLTPTGTSDNSFASGLFHEIVLTTQTEIYAFALDGDRITTGGYGRESGVSNVWASLRFNTTTGARSTTFGAATNGIKLVDPSAGTAANNCRFALGLPGGKTALIGSTGANGSREGTLAILTQDGSLDTTYGTGVHKFDFGADDQLWGGAVSGGKLLAVGWKTLASQTETANDDSYGVILPLQ